MMLQLNPMIPFWHVPTQQACHAFLAIDYTQEHDLMFTVILQNGEVWVCRASDLRGQENHTLGRPKHVADGAGPPGMDKTPNPFTQAGDPIMTSELAPSLSNTGQETPSGIPLTDAGAPPPEPTTTIPHGGSTSLPAVTLSGTVDDAGHTEE